MLWPKHKHRQITELKRMQTKQTYSHYASRLNKTAVCRVILMYIFFNCLSVHVPRNYTKYDTTSQKMTTEVII
jgi:hypothetical protein